MSNTGSSNGSASGSEQYYDFDEDESQEFIAWLNHYVNFNLSQMLVLRGGLSGARTWIVKVSGSGPVPILSEEHNRRSKAVTIPPNHYILKISLANKARAEYDHHHEVYSATDSTSIKGHMPAAFGPFAPERGPNPEKEDKRLAAIFYTPAGGGFANFHTMQDAIEDDGADEHVQQCIYRAADYLLNTWTLPDDAINGSAGADQHRVKVDDFIKVIARGLNGQTGRNRLEKLDAELAGVVYDTTAALVQVEFGNTSEKFLNPIPLVISQNLPESGKQAEILAGQTHRDVHPGNLIIRREKHANEDTSWKIIDFANYRGSADQVNALYDVAYLELILLIRAYEDFGTEKHLATWWKRERTTLRSVRDMIEFAQEVAKARSRAKDGLDGQPEHTSSTLDSTLNVARGDPVLQYVEPIGEVLAHLSDRLGSGSGSDDTLEYSFLAASIEAGLDFARKLKHHRQRRMAYLVAVSRFDTLLRKLDIYKKVRNSKDDKSSTDIRKIPRIPLNNDIIHSSEDLFDPIAATHSTTVRYSLSRRLRDSLHKHDGSRLVCLTGGRLSGKTAFLQAISGDERSEEARKTRAVVTVDSSSTADDPLTAGKYIMRFLDRLIRETGSSTDAVVDKRTIPEKLEAAATLAAILDPRMPIWCIDDVDDLVARLAEHGAVELQEFIIGLVEKGIAHVFMTAARSTTIGQMADQAATVRRAEDNSWWHQRYMEERIPNWKEQIDEILDMFETDAPLYYDPDARAKLCDYSGGFVYAMKFMVRALGDLRSSHAYNLVNVTEIDAALEVAMNTENKSKLHKDIFGRFDKVYSKMDETERSILIRMVYQSKAHPDQTRQSEEEGVTIANFVTDENRKHIEELKASLDNLVEMGVLRNNENSDEYAWHVRLWKMYMETKVKTVDQRDKLFGIDMANQRLYIGYVSARILPLSDTQLKLLDALYHEKDGMSASALNTTIFKRSSIDSIDNVWLAIVWLNQRVQNLLRAGSAGGERFDGDTDPTSTRAQTNTCLIMRDSTRANGDAIYRLNHENTDYTPDLVRRRA